MDFRQRLEQSRQPPVGGDEQTDNFTCPYFAMDRGNQPNCLELRLSDGNRTALPYSYFIEIGFDIDEGIEILTTQKRVAITGRNLAQLYDALIAYQVRYVQADVGNDDQDDGLFVSEILIERF